MEMIPHRPEWRVHRNHDTDSKTVDASRVFFLFLVLCCSIVFPVSIVIQGMWKKRERDIQKENIRINESNVVTVSTIAAFLRKK